MSRSTVLRGAVADPWRWAVRALQVALAVAAIRGATTGSLDLLSNALVGLLVTLVPDLLDRRWGVTFPSAFVAWLAVAAAFHVAGMAFGLYAPPTRYDDLTHSVSGSFVGATGVVVIRLWERRVDGLAVPNPYGIAIVLAVVMAGGVTWELIEFALPGGGRAIQTSLLDTVSDLLFNLAGGLAAVALGWSSLDGVAGDVASDLAIRADE